MSTNQHNRESFWQSLGLYPRLHRLRRRHGKYLDVSNQSVPLRRRLFPDSLYIFCCPHRLHWSHCRNELWPCYQIWSGRRIWLRLRGKRQTENSEKPLA